MLERFQPSAQIIVLIGVIVGLLGGLGSYALAVRNSGGEIVIANDPTRIEITVELRGEVASPGVYTLDGHARMTDLLTLAGGTTPDADLSQINLARRLADGELITITSVAPASPIANPPDNLAEATSPPMGLAYQINLNTASQPELESLPGIGPAIAARIISHRETNGPFRSVDDLDAVQGVSPNLINDIRSMVTVGP